MDDHDTDHEVGAPKMQCAEIPAQGLPKIQILKAGVSLIGGGHIDKGQTDAGHDLEDKTKQGAATEDIKPTACTCRHCVACGGFEELADMQSVINPKGNFSQHQNSSGRIVQSVQSLRSVQPLRCVQAPTSVPPPRPRGRMKKEVERLEQFERLEQHVLRHHSSTPYSSLCVKAVPIESATARRAPTVL